MSARVGRGSRALRANGNCCRAAALPEARAPRRPPACCPVRRELRPASRLRLGLLLPGRCPPGLPRGRRRRDDRRRGVPAVQPGHGGGRAGSDPAGQWEREDGQSRCGLVPLVAVFWPHRWRLGAQQGAPRGLRGSCAGEGACARAAAALGGSLAVRQRAASCEVELMRPDPAAPSAGVKIRIAEPDAGAFPGYELFFAESLQVGCGCGCGCRHARWACRAADGAGLPAGAGPL